MSSLSRSQSLASDAVHLSLFGRPCVHRANGSPIELSMGKPLALACFVALEPSDVTRDDLAMLLWPQVSEERARQSVRQAIWTLRNSIGDHFITEVNKHVTLGSHVSTDLSEMMRALANSDLDAAVDLWQGGVLLGLDIGDAPAFGRWADEIRAGYRQRLLGALQSQIDDAPASQRTRWLNLALHVDPSSEQLHHMRIAHLLDINDLDHAERALKSAHRQLDVDDQTRLPQLHSRLIRLQKAASASTAASELGTAFIVRNPAYRRLVELWAQAKSGTPTRVAIAGARGSGKTHLVNRVIDSVKADGAQVVQARAANPRIRIDLGTLASVVRGLTSLQGAAGISAGSSAVLQRLLPSRGPPPDRPSNATISSVALADAVADLVLATSYEAPLAIVIDEAHWFDQPSLQVLVDVVLRMPPGQPVMFMGCGDTEGDAFWDLHSVSREHELEEVILEPLEIVEIFAALRPLLPTLTAAELTRFATRLHRVGGGHVWRLEELLNQLVSDGHIVREGDTWAPANAKKLAQLPPTEATTEPLKRCLETLSDLQRQILLVLASAEHPLSRDEICDHVPATRGNLASALRTLTVHRLIVWNYSGTVALASAAVHELVRGRSGRLRDAVAMVRRLPIYLGRRFTLRLVTTIVIFGVLVAISFLVALTLMKPD